MPPFVRSWVAPSPSFYTLQESPFLKGRSVHFWKEMEFALN